MEVECLDKYICINIYIYICTIFGNYKNEKLFVCDIDDKAYLIINLILLQMAPVFFSFTLYYIHVWICLVWIVYSMQSQRNEDKCEMNKTV